MDKKSFNFKSPENVKLAFQGQEIEIKPYLSLAEQGVLLASYVKNLYYPAEVLVTETIGEEGKQHLLNAEYTHRLDVVSMVTNIDLSDFDISGLFYSGLWGLVRASIVNYFDFEELLHKTIADKAKELELQKSLGTVVDSLAGRAEKIMVSLGEAIQTIKDEDLDKLKEIAATIAEQLKSPVVASIVQDMERGEPE